MPADAHSVFGSDEPSLRRLTLSNTGFQRQRDSQQRNPQQSSNQQSYDNSQENLQQPYYNPSTQSGYDRYDVDQFVNPGDSLPQNDSSAYFSDLPASGVSVLIPSRSQLSPLDNPEWSHVDALSAQSARASTWGQKMQGQIQRTLGDQVTPIRLAGHVSVLVVAAVILILSQVKMPNWELTLRAFPTTVFGDAGDLSRNIGMQVPRFIAGENSGVAINLDTSLQPAVVPFTIIPEKPTVGIQVYVVQPGDTVSAIAARFGLRPESIQWANPSLELNPDLLKVGDELSILPVDGALHQVQPNDTLSTIAAKYKVSIEGIIGYQPNEIADAAAPLIVGTQLIVPGGVKPYVAPQVFAYNGTVPTSASKGTGAFGWPTSGSVTQRFWSGHKAIDIGAWTGAPVKAADSGHVTVAQSGWNNGYGKFVIIDHGNGYVSLYAHMNSIFVQPGENVARGVQIGTVGNTGNSTGPHLHFEILYQGTSRNPFSYLN